MGRIYGITYTGTITNAGGDTDLLSVQPADDKPVQLRGMILSQTSEIGDAQEEGLRITIRRMTSTFTVGSGGSGIPAIPTITDEADIAFSFTARCNDTTVATSNGNNRILYDLGWNERNTPYEMWFPDERFAPKVKQTEGLVVRMETTPADDLTGSFTFILEEM